MARSDRLACYPGEMGTQLAVTIDAARDDVKLPIPSSTKVSHVLTLREAELEERLRSRERALEESREQLLQLMSAVQRDQATIRARDTRIAALETDGASYRDQLKNVLARAVDKSRLLSERKSDQRRQNLRN